MMVIDNKFELGEILYLKTDAEQLGRIVTAIIVCPDDSYLYELTCGTHASKHYDFEISQEKNFVNA
jgi:hypothetical protein